MLLVKVGDDIEIVKPDPRPLDHQSPRTILHHCMS
jgi:hypothetical protein